MGVAETGLGDLGGLLQPSWFYDSMILSGSVVGSRRPSTFLSKLKQTLVPAADPE